MASASTSPSLLGIAGSIKKGTRRFREVPNSPFFYRLLCKVDPDSLAEKLTGWLREQSGSLPGALAMDGTFIRGTVGVLSLADHETDERLNGDLKKRDHNGRSSEKSKETSRDHHPSYEVD